VLTVVPVNPERVLSAVQEGRSVTRVMMQAWITTASTACGTCRLAVCRVPAGKVEKPAQKGLKAAGVRTQMARSLTGTGQGIQAEQVRMGATAAAAAAAVPAAV
jgi:hypothetical protein